MLGKIISIELSKYIKDAGYYYDLPGLAIHVGIDKQDYFSTYGWQNAIDKSPLKPEHIFHMASVTKLFVGTAILKLWEENLLDLDGKAFEYLAEFHMADKRYKDITIRHLLSHTSGMPDVKDYHWENPETDSGALLRYIQSPEVSQGHLIYNPGQGKFAYSNMAYELLGAIIASVSASSFEDYVEKNIFKPLKMFDSDLLTFRRDMSSVCFPHQKNEENHFSIVGHFPYNRAHGPSSTLTSNLADMAKWSKAIFNSKILMKKTMKEAWKPHAMVPNNNEGICLAWFRREQEGHVLYGHEGNDDGFRASHWICPKLEISITVCSNLTGAPVKRINREVFSLICDKMNL